jgi:hypothetical protein
MPGIAILKIAWLHDTLLINSNFAPSIFIEVGKPHRPENFNVKSLHTLFKKDKETSVKRGRDDNDNRIRE